MRRSEVLQAFSDRSAAHQVATDCLALANRYKVSGVAADRLAAASLALRLWSCGSDGGVEPSGEDTDALAARISDPDNAALFGLEARLWATIVRLQDPATRVPGIALAEGLLPQLDAAGLGRVALTWRLHLGTALARTGALEITGAALRPLLNLAEEDELRGAAEAVATTLGSAVGDSLLAIAALEAELAAMPPEAADDHLRLRHALAHLHSVLGSRRSALLHGLEELRHRVELLGPEHPETLTTRSNIALWTGQTGDTRQALTLLQELLPDHIRMLGPDHPATLTTRGNIAYWTGQTGDAHQPLTLYQELLPDHTRILGPDHPATLTTRGNIALWTGARAGMARKRLRQTP